MNDAFVYISKKEVFLSDSCIEIMYTLLRTFSNHHPHFHAHYLRTLDSLQSACVLQELDTH